MRRPVGLLRAGADEISQAQLEQLSPGAGLLVDDGVSLDPVPSTGSRRDSAHPNN